MKQGEMPIGLGMALAQNPQAMKAFTMMSDAKQQQIIEGTHTIHSKQEMHEYVNKMLTKQ